MVSPNDSAPKGKADSIWSVDSGYGSNAVDEDETPQRYSGPRSSTEKQCFAQPIGLGISDFWNVHVEDKLRVRKPESPVEPITTRVNVLTVKAPTTGGPGLPSDVEDGSPCVTCQLWDMTTSGENLKCEECRSRDFIGPEVRCALDQKRKGKQPVPRLQIPQSTRPHQCSTCHLAETIDSSFSTCQSCTPDPELLSPFTSVPESTVRRSCARRAAKLPPYALQHLRAWLKANVEHPYPSADTKRALAQECGITEKQVTTWFTNTRARKLAHDLSIAESEDEGADESDYSNRANTPMYTTPVTVYDTTPIYYPGSSMPGHARHLSPQTSRRGKKKDYRRVTTISPTDNSPLPRTPATPSPTADSTAQETWQCTFCYQPLVPKSWRRHEETQHRPKHQWTCLATGPRLTIPSRTGGTTTLCAFCSLANPDASHFSRHRIAECMAKRSEDRTFGRPDHLRQHVRNFHKAGLMDAARDMWRRDGPGKGGKEGWVCGFCGVELGTWDERERHVAAHFKQGKTMAEWMPQAQASTVTPRSPQSHDIHTTMLSRLTNASRQHPFLPSPPTPTPTHNHTQNPFPHPFIPLSESERCVDIAPAPALPEIPDMGFASYIPDFMPYDMSGGFGATYGAYGGVYQGDEGFDDGLAGGYGYMGGGC